MSSILLWGERHDRPLIAVAEALHRLDVNPFLLDQGDTLRTRFDLEIGDSVHGTLRVGGGPALHLEDVTAAYVRTYDWRALPAIRRSAFGGPEWRHAQRLEEGLSVWLEISPALVVNRPSAMATNGSKPYQAELIRRCGFDIPETVITTDVDVVRDFVDRHGAVIYKSVSGVRSIVSRLTPAHFERIADVAWCPTQFQAYVRGTDHRVHVVGQDVFACEIISEADDYRYASRSGVSAIVRAVALPDEVAERCCALVRDLGLVIGGVDLRRTPDGRWVCFEVNPSPGFTYYEELSGQPLADAIARALLHGETCGSADDEVGATAPDSVVSEPAVGRRMVARSARGETSGQTLSPRVTA